MEQEFIDHYVFYGMIRKLAFKTMHVRLYASKRLHLVNGGREGRRQCTTTGFSAEVIQRRGRWVSEVWKFYIQGNSEGAEAMTRRMSTNSTIPHDRLKGAWAA